MATIVENTTEGIIYRSEKTYSVPDVDILTLLFDSNHTLAKPDTLLHVSASYPDLALTTSQLRDLTYQTSAALRKHFEIGFEGAGRDVCSVVSTGHYLLPVLYYGIIGAGGVLSSASASIIATELCKQLEDAHSTILITNESAKDVAVEAAEEAGWGCNGGGRVVLMSDGPDWSLNIIQSSGQLSLNLLDENERLPWRKITDPNELANSLAVMFYSSGTTGPPKGVKISHRNMVAATILFHEPMRAGLLESRPDFQYRTLAHLPSSHIAGFLCYFTSPTYMGGTVYWMPAFEFSGFLEYNATYKITFLITVPPIYLGIAKSPEVKDQFKTLEIAISVAAPLGKELQYAASQKLGSNCFISQGWGLTETTGTVTVMPVNVKDDTGSVSALLPNILIRLVNDDGKDVKAGGRGEVLIQGPTVTKGYYQNEAADRESFTGEWFRTGDVATFRNGLLYIVDRKKELIKYKGLQVAPAELEALLINHPDISDAAVIGVNAEDGINEVPRAYVVASGNNISGQQIKDYVQKNMASHKQLRGGVYFLDVIPKSASGKILRKELRVLAKKEHGAKL